MIQDDEDHLCEMNKVEKIVLKLNISSAKSPKKVADPVKGLVVMMCPFDRSIFRI